MLTDLKIKALKPRDKPYKVFDGDRLYLHVRVSGKKYWRVRFKLRGKDGLFTIGEYPMVSLYQARRERDKVAEQISLGVDPNIEKKAEALREKREDSSTFFAVSEVFFEKKKEGLSDHYVSQWNSIMARDVYPVIGGMPISRITAPYLLEILETIEKRGAPTVALLARQFMGQVFRYAGARLLVEADPTVFLAGVIKRPKVRHNPPLEKPQLIDFFEKLALYKGFPPTVIAIKLMANTFIRTKELRSMKWSFLEGDTIIFPEEVMKMSTKHVVPLSTQSLALIEELRKYNGGHELMFPNARDPSRSMSSTTINRVIERLGYRGDFSGHGFRSTASTMLNEMGYREDLIERQLSHMERKGQRRAYNHAEYMPERRAMMQDWSDFLVSLGV
ncbi:tyrosine-type recombinase/integrase [Marinomonas transparens]|uniref:Tyrosine-type recombinase/integrase n=1 Tax=Marinomonas transparens TaxID=2795388 RepID=A0A934JM92_9GAMM|nr:integrase arm-type DNA-binding domain-containing protein [Marinomonas transparens]MBJ7536998.1 tyrosine-type recombinase/integrase [Marinomonas transparens]